MGFKAKLLVMCALLLAAVLVYITYIDQPATSSVFGPADEPEPQTTVWVHINGSASRESHEVIPQGNVTPEDILIALEVPHEVRNGTLYSIGADYNSRSMHWVVYLDGTKTTLEALVRPGQVLEFSFENYMEV